MQCLSLKISLLSPNTEDLWGSVIFHFSDWILANKKHLRTKCETKFNHNSLNAIKCETGENVNTYQRKGKTQILYYHISAIVIRSDEERLILMKGKV